MAFSLCDKVRRRRRLDGRQMESLMKGLEAIISLFVRSARSSEFLVTALPTLVIVISTSHLFAAHTIIVTLLQLSSLLNPPSVWHFGSLINITKKSLGFYSFVYS